MKISVNVLHFPVTTLGWGKRVGIWVQGCAIRCPGCISQDTWDQKRDFEIEIESLVRDIMPWLDQADGVTISGGEPFDQPAALVGLLAELRTVGVKEILLFSGYPLEVLQANHGSLLELVDVLVSDPFVAGAGERLPLRGSDNQRITLLSPLARQRYLVDLNAEAPPTIKSLNLAVGSHQVYMAGIPRQGDMKQLRTNLERRGFRSVTSDQRQEPR